MVSEPSEPPIEGESAVVRHFSKAGRKIGIGDCALFKAESAPPFIGIIRKAFSEKGGGLKLCVNWLYRFVDVKLGRGAPLEAAPNEIFYSFHEDEISAASLLHPCKVAFLQKGVDLPSGVSSFVCRRVYDIANKCLRWLTDQNYTDERQAEIDELLDRTKHEMQATTQSDCPSQRTNTSTSSKPQSTNVTLTSQVKTKKRTRPELSSDSCKRERSMKAEEGESKRECSMKFDDFASIADKDGGITNTNTMEQLLQVMLQERNDNLKRITDIVPRRTLLAGIIASTEKEDCLTHFVQQGGLPVLDDWLQEAHKGKHGDGSPKEGDKGLEELLLTLLRALDKLPVDLDALKTYMVGKSVNNLRSHRNSEIQKKARKLVETWKKRVDAEMKSSDEKSGQNAATTWSSKSTSETHNSKGRSAASLKSTSGKPSANGSADAKVNLSGAHKEHSTSKEASGKSHGSAVNEMLAPVKEEKSCASSQSQNNSQGKGSGSWREEVKAHSVSSVKTSGTTLRSHNHNHSSKSHPTSNSTGLQKDQVGRHKTPGSDSKVETSTSQRLIVRFPNPGRSPSHSVSGGSVVDRSTSNQKSSSPASIDRHGPLQENCKAPTIHSPDASGDAKCGNSSANGVKSTPERSKDDADKSCMATAEEIDSKPSKSSEFERRSEDEHTGIGKALTATNEAPVSAIASPNIIGLDNLEGGIDLLASIAAREGSEAEKSATGSTGGEGNCLSSEANRDSTKNGNHAIEEETNHKDGQFEKEKEGGPVNGYSDAAPSAELITSAAEEAVVVGDSCKESGLVKQVEEGAVSSSVDPACGDNSSGKETSASFALTSNASTGIEDEPCDNNLVPRGATDVHKEATSVQASRAISQSGKAQEPTASGSENATCQEEDSQDLEEGGSCPTSDTRPHLTPRNSAENLSGFYDDDDALEVARQVAKEVEQEVETYDPPDVNALSPSKTDTKAEGTLENSNVNDVCAGEDKVEGGVTIESSPNEPNQDVKDEISNPSAMGIEANIHARCPNVDDKVVQSLEIPHESAVSVEKKEEQKAVLETATANVAAEVAHVTETLIMDTKTSTSENKEIERPIFDLNEGFTSDELANEMVQLTSGSAVNDSLATQPNSVAAPVAVVAATKGAFIPPSNPSRSKAELGWKGSAATSAFRPAEPRRINDSSQPSLDASTTADAGESNKRTRFLDIDLNVADERVIEDSSTVSSLALGHVSVDDFNRNNGHAQPRLELDLNRVDECDDISVPYTTISKAVDLPSEVNKGVSQSRGMLDFDLNDGFGLEEPATEEVSSQQKGLGNSSIPVLVGMGSTPDIVNTAAWYSAPTPVPATMVLPSYSSGRVEPSYPVVAAPNVKPVVTMTHNLGPFTGDVYRVGAPLSSSTVSYSTSIPAAFPYPGFPYGAGFSFTSASYNVASSPLLASATSPPFLTAPPLVTASAVSSSYGRPYLMGGIREGQGADTNTAWMRPSLDLNAGPDIAVDLDSRDDIHGSRIGAGITHLSYQQSLPPGATIKRKEPESGFDPIRSSFKQMTWR